MLSPLLVIWISRQTRTAELLGAVPGRMYEAVWASVVRSFGSLVGAFAPAEGEGGGHSTLSSLALVLAGALGYR